MLFSVISLFPQMFEQVFNLSILKRAQEKKLLEIRLINLRDFTLDKYKTVDDTPFGGGVGMLLKIDVVDKAISFAKAHTPGKSLTILLDPQGVTLSQILCRKLSQNQHIILLCGHYEGVDARVYDIVDLRLSIGNFILTGGEIPAMAVVDGITRLIPGVLPQDALTTETFTDNKYEFPQYTRPRMFQSREVPRVLLSGDHRAIEAWRKREALRVTFRNRPDLLRKSIQPRKQRKKEAR